MRKNVASQVIGAQMIAASDGSAFTGSVTVYVTGNGGTQAIGSVGSGACTHEGNGFHTYAPAQAETNYDHVAFTFIGTGAIPTTVQVYPNFPQTGDAFARLGAPAGASVSADVAAVKMDTAATLVDTAEIGAAGAGLTALASAANLTTVAGYLDTEIAALIAELAKVPKSDGAVSWNATALAAINAQADLALSDYDGPTNAELTAALAAADDAVLAAIAALSTAIGNVPTAVENADALLTRNWASVTEGSGRTALQALRILRNRWVISGATQSIKKEDDTTESWSQTLGTTTGAEPVTSTDPA
jgi:hypothetical protein